MDVRYYLQNILDSVSDIKYHPDLVNDFEELLNNTGLLQDFASKFFFNLLILSDKKEKTHNYYSNNFEKLKTEDDMYSMRIKLKGCNARILYSFLSDGTILLHCFYERGGKKNTDYTKAIKIAAKRKLELEQEDNYD